MFKLFLKFEIMQNFQYIIIAKTKCAKIENETSKTSLFFASFFLLASGFVKCKLNAD